MFDRLRRAGLDELERETVDGLEYARKTGSSFVFAIILNKLYLIRRLRGLPLDFRLFDGTAFDQGDYEQYLAASPNLTNPAYQYWMRKTAGLRLRGRLSVGA